MPGQVMEISSLSPLLFGTGKPFSTDPGSLNADTLPLPLPSTLANALRSTIAQEQEWFDYRADLLLCEQRGPLLMVDGTAYFPKPLDAVPFKKDKKVVLFPGRPSDAGGCDLPEKELRPVLATPQDDCEPTKDEDDKPFWSANDVVDWLCHSSNQPFNTTPATMDVCKERRVHVGMVLETRAAERSALYQTEGVCLTTVLERKKEPKKGEDPWLKQRFSLLTEFDATAIEQEIHSNAFGLGGERRLVTWQTPGVGAFDCEEKIRTALGTKPRGIRLQLATPALFDHGWRPAWTNLNGVELKLVAAAVGRRQPVSGWDVQKRRPKPVRWMAPAGSVFFFEVVGGDPTSLADAWLTPVSDNEQDKRDGFGLALWGVWEV